VFAEITILLNVMYGVSGFFGGFKLSMSVFAADSAAMPSFKYCPNSSGRGETELPVASFARLRIAATDCPPAAATRSAFEPSASVVTGEGAMTM